MTLIKGPVLDLFGTHTSNTHNQQNGGVNLQHAIKGSVMITIGCFSCACFMILQVSFHYHHLQLLILIDPKDFFSFDFMGSLIYSLISLFSRLLPLKPTLLSSLLQHGYAYWEQLKVVQWHWLWKGRIFLLGLCNGIQNCWLLSTVQVLYFYSKHNHRLWTKHKKINAHLTLSLIKKRIEENH